MANLVFIPNATSKGSGGVQISLDNIPDEVKKDVEEVYAALKTNPGRMRAEFASLGELNLYITQVKAYCDQRPEGAIKFRKSPSRGLPPTTMEFRITDLQTENEQTTEAIRDGVKAIESATTGKTK